MGLGLQRASFWTKVQKTKKCWNWIGAKNNKGYGRFWNGTIVESAHRFSWRIHYTEPIGSKLVLHNCDNPACVRPTHLRLGSQTENMRDALTRDRGHGRSKLKPSDVRVIRQLCADRLASLSVIAAQFGITKGAVGHIKYGVTWSWLP